MENVLVIDCHNLCYRAAYSTGELSYQGRPTGIIYGFLRTISGLMQEFATNRIIFCFEGGQLIRKQLFEDYKSNRKKDEEKEKIRAAVSAQIKELRLNFLPQLGFRNLWMQEGYEADDLLAVAAKFQPDYGDAMLLVTSDQDLYQCLNAKVSIYCPRKAKRYTAKSFIQEWGIFPQNWAIVKAIAGCKGDGVPGIPGVAEKTAVRFLTNQLPSNHKTFRAIHDNRSIILRNRQLVELPMRGCLAPAWEPDCTPQGNWRKVCTELGIRTIAGPTTR